MNEFHSSELESGFILGPWRVEPCRNTISREGVEKHLENRLMQTLVYLAEHRGQVISRERFFDSVWQGLVVNEEALSRAISLLRTALGDKAHAPEFIQTVPGVGYRLIADRMIIEARKQSPPPDNGVQKNSIAVLPFINLSDDPANEYFSEGISEEILNVLAQVESFDVVARTSSFAFKNRHEDLRGIGRILNASHVLEGSVRKAGSRVRITAQIIKTDDGFHLWSGTFDRQLDDIFEVQDEIALSVVKQLKRTLLPETPKVVETNPKAYALFLQSRYLERQSTTKGFSQALALMKQALAIAPDYAAAWNGLSSIYCNMAAKADIAPDMGYRMAKEAALKALEHNPDYALAHARLGWISAHFSPDLATSAKHYQRALALAPTDIDIIGSAAHLARSLGRLETSITLLEYALARDPINPTRHRYLGFNYRCSGRADESVASYNTALQLSPDTLSARYNIGMARLFQGQLENALAETLLEKSEIYRLMGLVPIYHDLGMARESDEALAEMIEKYDTEAAYNIGFLFAYRGENDQAFLWLEKALANNDSGLSQINTEPIIARLHSDPRWLPFMQRIGMSDEQLDAIEFEVELPG